MPDMPASTPSGAGDGTVSLSRSLELLVNFLQGRTGAGPLPPGGDVTPAQFVLLRYLLWNPGSSVARVADSLNVSRPAATQAVDRLVQRGLVRRRADAGDRRRLRLVLTPRGEALVRYLMRSRERQLEDIVARMPVHHRDALARGIDAFLVAALDNLSLVQAACLRCGSDHDEECPVNRASLQLTGRPVGELEPMGPERRPLPANPGPNPPNPRNVGPRLPEPAGLGSEPAASEVSQA